VLTSDPMGGLVSSFYLWLMPDMHLIIVVTGASDGIGKGYALEVSVVTSLEITAC